MLLGTSLLSLFIENIKHLLTMKKETSQVKTEQLGS